MDITIEDITKIFEEWDSDGDEVLTMKEWLAAIEKPDEAEKIPKLQIARVNRAAEKAVEDEQNLEWQYWDLGDFIKVLQTPCSYEPERMSKAEKKKFNSKERRWAPKVIETEDQEDNTILKHTTGSIAITKDAFIERYHGDEEWNAATVRLMPTQAKKSRGTQLKKWN